MASLARNSSCARTHSGLTVQPDSTEFCAAIAGTAISNAKLQTTHVRRSKRTDPPFGNTRIHLSSILFFIHINGVFLHIRGKPMRTNIEIDEQLVRQVMRKIGAPTEKAAVDAGL